MPAAESISRTSEKKPRAESLCASAPPNSSAPTTAAIDTRDILILMTGHEDQQALQGRVAVVTGGSRGIGLAVTTALVVRGVNVVMCGRSEDSLASALDQAAAAARGIDAAGSVVSVSADLRSPDAAAEVIDRAERSFGGLDVLVNNAGVGRFESLTEQSVADWLEVIETNLNGIFYC